MRYKLSLHDRMRYAQAKRLRYHADPAYRLQRINENRVRTGLAELTSLSETTLRIRVQS